MSAARVVEVVTGKQYSKALIMETVGWRSPLQVNAPLEQLKKVLAHAGNRFTSHEDR